VSDNHKLCLFILHERDDRILEHPQHRSLLRALLQAPAPEGSKQASGGSFLEAELDGEGFSIAACAQRDASGIEKVPTSGKLRFKYCAAMPETPRGDSNPYAKMFDWQNRGRVAMPLRRWPSLMAALRTCESDLQREMFLEGCGLALHLRPSQLALLTRATAA